MSRIRSRHSLVAPFALAAASALGACGGEVTSSPPNVAGAARCEGRDLAACESALGAAITHGRDAKDLARAYLRARLEADGDDALGALGRELMASNVDGPVVVVLGGAGAPASRSARVLVRPGPLPEAGPALGAHGWLLAISAATGQHAIAVTPDGVRRHALANDPLRPVVGGLPAVMTTRSASSVDEDVSLARGVAEAYAAAAAFDYLTAARASEALGKLRTKRDEGDALARRARVAESTLAHAGILLAPTEDVVAAAPTVAPSVAPAPGETPYEAMLAVRSATDVGAAYAPRRAALAQALGPELGALLDAWVGVPDDLASTCPQAAVPDFTDDRQLAFAGLLPLGLLPAQVTADAARGRLPLAAWYPRYEALRARSEATGLTWWTMSTLLSERGSGSGVSPSATSAHRAVTASAKKHLAALTKLVRGAEGRTGFDAINGVATLGGVREDPELAPLVVDLAQRSTQIALANAKDAGEVALALVGGISTALTYPPELQGAQLSALQGAFTAQLRGNLANERGWSVAGLLALDAAYRLLFQQAPDLPGSSSAIARALGGPDVEQPGLAALTVAASRYAALGATGELGAPFLEKGKGAPKPMRAEARAAMREALGHLGGEGSAPPSPAAVDELTDLVDGSVATLAMKLASAPDGAPAACADAPRDPKITRALGKLRDVRRKLVAAPWFRAGDDAWSRRARLIVLVASDTFDLADSDEGAVRFAIDPATASRILAEVVDGWSPKGTADLLAGVHGMARGYLTKDSPGASVALARALRGAHAMLTDENEGALAGAGIIDLVANQAVLGARSSDGPLSLERDLLPALLREAEKRGRAGDVTSSDLLLLTIAGLSAATEAHAAPDGAVALARTLKSRTAWVLVERQTAARLANAAPIDEAQVRAALATSVPPACGKATTDMVADVASGVSAFRAGRRDEARTKMRAVVEALEAAPPVLPRSTFGYRETAGTRVLQATIGMTLGAGLLTSSNTFQVGLGYQSIPTPRSASLRVTIDPVESSTTTEIGARFAVHAAALAAVYELLGGDLQRAERAGAVAYARATRGARTAEGQPAIAKDAAGALAVAAQLFAEAGRPILSGDLWALVKSTIDPASDDAQVADVLDTAPFGLPKSTDGEAATARARKTLGALTEKLACTKEKVDLARFETPRCGDYPLAVALRIADSVPRLPRLAVTDARTCTHASLDRFFGKMEAGSYDPDALTAALDDRIAEGHGYDASVLLTRLRPQEHCSGAIVGAARKLGELQGLPPAIRADARFAAVKCDPSLLADAIVGIDGLYMSASDLDHAGELLFAAAKLAEVTNDATALARLFAQPRYHERWAQRNATLAAASLALDHAATTLSPQPDGAAHLAASKPLVDTLCTTFAAPERASPCAAIAGLARTDTPIADRKRLATETIASIVKALTGT